MRKQMEEVMPGLTNTSYCRLQLVQTVIDRDRRLSKLGLDICSMNLELIASLRRIVLNTVNESGATKYKDEIRVCLTH